MRKNLWELKQSAKENTLDLYIYGDVEGDYYSWWDGWTQSETSAKSFRDELAKWPDVTQINLFINSYGGSVFEGTAIYSQLARHPAHKTAYIDGFACSIASVIAMACDEIVMPRNTMMMIHNILSPPNRRRRVAMSPLSRASAMAAASSMVTSSPTISGRTATSSCSAGCSALSRRIYLL